MPRRCARKVAAKSALGSFGSSRRRSSVIFHALVGSGPSESASISSYLSEENLWRSTPALLCVHHLQIGIVLVDFLEHPLLVIGVCDVDALHAHLQLHDGRDGAVLPQTLPDRPQVLADLRRMRLGVIEDALAVRRPDERHLPCGGIPLSIGTDPAHRVIFKEFTHGDSKKR